MVCIGVDDVDCLLRFTGVDAEEVWAAAGIEWETGVGGEIGDAHSAM